MPHECTNCGHVFPDGSKEMLSGCPDCGGKKFQFRPSSSRRNQAAEESSGQPAAAATAESTGTADGRSKADKLLEQSDSPDPSTDREDVAQASARSEMVGDDDLPTSTASADAEPQPESDAPDMASLRNQLDDTEDVEAGTDGLVGSPVGSPVESPVEGSGPDAAEMEQIREELNAQFESIKVLAPGQYELNLMELYDRDEYIIALQQNGRYVIEVPNGWDDDDS